MIGLELKIILEKISFATENYEKLVSSLQDSVEKPKPDKIYKIIDRWWEEWWEGASKKKS